MALPATNPPPAQWAVGGAAPLPRTVSARAWRRQRATGWGARGAAARGNAPALWGSALLLFRRRCVWRGTRVQILHCMAANGSSCASFPFAASLTTPPTPYRRWERAA